MPRSVAIVFDPAFGDRLRPLAFRVPVWLVDTPENRFTAAEVSREAVDWPHISVTIFRPLPAEATPDDWLALFQQVELELGTAEGLDVIGAEALPAARAALEQARFNQLEETAGGFRAKKKR